MPLLRVTHTAGSFTEEQRDALAERFTHEMLVAEIGADNAAARAVAYVHFVELDALAGEWYVGGKRETSTAASRIVIDVYYPEGAASQANKTGLHSALFDVVGDVLGRDGASPSALGEWVFIHEVPEGNWGAGGTTVGLELIHAAAQGDPARIPRHRSFLEARRRRHDGSGACAHE